MTDITNCDSYYKIRKKIRKVWHALQRVTGIKKCQNYYKVRRNIANGNRNLYATLCNDLYYHYKIDFFNVYKCLFLWNYLKTRKFKSICIELSCLNVISHIDKRLIRYTIHSFQNCIVTHPIPYNRYAKLRLH